MFKFTLFLAGFAAGFFFTYLLCSGYLVDHLPEKALEHKDQVKHNFGCSRTVSWLPPGRYWLASLAGFSVSRGTFLAAEPPCEESGSLDLKPLSLQLRG